MDNPPSPPLSSHPTSAVLQDQADQLKVDRLERVRANWDFKTMLDNVNDPASQKRLRLHFTKDAAWTMQTIKAFKRLAQLIADKKKRNEHLETLRKMWCI